MAYSCNEIHLTVHKDEATYFNMDEIWKHYVKWNYRTPYTVWFYFYKTSRIEKGIKIESRLVIA